MLYYSSGTTGKSKLISYSNEAILENQKSLVSSRLTYNRNIHLCFLPLYHTASLRYSIKFNLCVGGTVVLFKNFWSLKDSIWKIVDKYKINYFQTVPTILNVILNTKYTKFSRPKSIKFVGSSSAILPWQMKKNFEKKFKIKISNLYGLSEIGCSHFQDPFVKNEKPGFIGKILPAFKFKIFKENNLSKNIDVGELGIKSKALLSNYYNNNKLYKKSFKKNFFLTGDYVSIDSKKNFFYIDRKKDLIIKGGVNILPSEIETVLQKLKEVKDVAVTSIFDEFYGENICCYLVFHKNVKIDLKKIDSYCLMQLGSFKKPDNYHILEDLPKGPSGKVLKIELKKINEK
jgi:long-chain acyl-CoA synthetase